MSIWIAIVTTKEVPEQEFLDLLEGLGGYATTKDRRLLNFYPRKYGEVLIILPPEPTVVSNPEFVVEELRQELGCEPASSISIGGIRKSEKAWKAGEELAQLVIDRWGGNYEIG